MTPDTAKGTTTMITNAVADDSLSAYLKMRPRLLGIARRMLGCAAAAEDLVQDVWLRWQTVDHSAVHDPGAFLAATATRLALNVIQSARARRETYVDTLLPEPVDTAVGPALSAEQGEALQRAMRLLALTLSPTERTAFILREAFQFAYRDIAATLRLQEANARQIVTRARQRLASRRVPVSVGHKASPCPVTGA